MSDALRAIRLGLWPVSLLFGAAARLRGVGYDRGLFAAHRLDVLVISVGNLTVGGNGKTPLVVWLVERARALGRRPGVLARGYGRAPGARLNDEGLLLEQRFPGLPQEQAPDRVAAGHRLLAQHALDVIFLDDGFQHRRLVRDFDLVCVDARRPFAEGRFLPSGELREPPSALRRAHAIVLTRADGLDSAAIAVRRATLRRFAQRELPIVPAEHAPQDVLLAPVGVIEPVAWLRGRRVVLLSSIARPASFEQTVAALGATIEAHHVRRDHHRHDPAAIAELAYDTVRRGAILLTTEKDGVKLAALEAPIAILRVSLRFLDGEPPLHELGLA